MVSLLQVHYHFRTGGVKEVIKGYAEAFSAISSKNCFNALLCSCSDLTIEDKLKVINVTECDYKDFVNNNEFEKSKEIIINKIETVLRKIPVPAVIICHNMTLPKNPALSSALRVLAKRMNPQHYRFFWVVHDFAEEGRVDMLKKIEKLENLGIDIKRNLYAAGAPVHYIVPGINAFTILKNAGINVTYLPNPVKVLNVPYGAFNHDDLLNKLTDLARSDGCRFDSNIPVCNYMSRVIGRKNILEAILLACVCLNYNLILGAPGTSYTDVNLYRKILNLAREKKIRVVFDTSRLRWDSITKKVYYSGNPVPYLYTICNIAISTSLAEGFGYALYEPWLYKKAVFARRPSGFIYPEQINSSLLYEHFPVPVEWVNLEILKQKYRSLKLQCKVNCAAWKDFESSLIISETVDFALLDVENQIAIIKKLISDDSIKTRYVEFLNNTHIPGWPGLGNAVLPNDAVIQTNNETLLKLFSNNDFIGTFKECISIIPANTPSCIEYDGIASALIKGGFKLFFSNSGGYNENI